MTATATLVLRLAAPMQAWGTTSRFADRATDMVPSKSGVIGLIMAALGAARDDHATIEMLAKTRFAVRVDSPGVIEHDLQTARNGDDVFPLSQRAYLADAVFVAFIEFEHAGDARAVAEALNHPIFTPYLGRKAFLPTGPLVLGVHDGPIEPLLTEVSHQGRAHYSVHVSCEVHIDADSSAYDRVVRDVPVSFAGKKHRDRFVKITAVQVVNENAAADSRAWFDTFFEALPRV
ncbi:type I-E CRISPR-associated protein Cas5/CasD [Aeromicrobium sp. 179-A 4D2 NHS]|uniref:type I-E CRISPR-associated protein Cas5/CasD n=1 Tax=Aeromicrobium sp. 179-A 4D2 NHS TaxID=3142375 RepID=UPI0039A379E9